MVLSLEKGKMTSWGIPFDTIFKIAGPCSAESESQIMQTAQALKNYDVNLFRAGIWKPRTSPKNFEGVGDKGLKWLKQVKEELELPVTVEVAIPAHVDACLKHDIDVLWVGARTTANPFNVQALADALKGVDIPVLVKNPINPEIGLWIGALERFNRVGITKLAAVHRGFSTYRRERFRYPPIWRIPIELKRLHPEVPVICDPSHICGNRDLLLQVAQTAMELRYDGLMIEVHNNPSVALSDANQQLTPNGYHDIIKSLKIKETSSRDQEYLLKMDELRSAVDDIDEQIIELLAKRMETVKKIGAWKEEKNISILQPERWREIIRSRIKDGKARDLKENFILHLFQCIHEESIRSQQNF